MRPILHCCILIHTSVLSIATSRYGVAVYGRDFAPISAGPRNEPNVFGFERHFSGHGCDDRQSGVDSSIMARKLRIAVSVFFGLLTVALCVLWVRSFCINDSVQRIGPSVTSLYSNNGYLGVRHLPKNFHLQYPGPGADWKVVSTAADGRVPRQWAKFSGFEKSATMPTLLIALPAAAFACLPWVRAGTRFSLRTLLIATTLVAVVLGRVVWTAAS